MSTALEALLINMGLNRGSADPQIKLEVCEEHRRLLCILHPSISVIVIVENHIN